jgi:hypothetical protein
VVDAAGDGSRHETGIDSASGFEKPRSKALRIMPKAMNGLGWSSLLSLALSVGACATEPLDCTMSDGSCPDGCEAIEGMRMAMPDGCVAAPSLLGCTAPNDLDCPSGAVACIESAEGEIFWIACTPKPEGFEWCDVEFEDRACE